MKKVLTFLFVIMATVLHAQDEFARFYIGGDAFTVEIDPNINSSAIVGGANTMVSGSDGKTMSVTAMFPGKESGEFKLTGSYSAPMVSMALSADKIYLIQEGVLYIDEYSSDGWVSGHFEGKASVANTGDDETLDAKGEFKLKIALKP